MPRSATADEIDRLKAALHAANARRDELRKRAEHAEAILSGLLPGPVSDALVDARNHQSRAEGVSPAADWGRLVGRAQVLAAAQPVVEWRQMLDGRTGEVTTHAAEVGDVALRVAEKQWRARSFPGWRGEKPGWAVVFGMKYVAASGPETGPAGKAAAEAAYRRACGFPPQAVPVAPQVVQLHQAYEGTTVCLHCGKPQPWPEMDRCPRVSGFHTAPPCAG